MHGFENRSIAPVATSISLRRGVGVGARAGEVASAERERSAKSLTRNYHPLEWLVPVSPRRPMQSAIARRPAST